MMLSAQGHQRGHRRRRGGQSLVEMALVAPILVVMLVGAAQVGSLAFGLVSIDSATREGARAGALSPTGALTTYVAGVAQTWYVAGTTTTHQCTTSDFTRPTTNPPTSGNPVCLAVLDSGGTLSQNLFTSNPCGSASQACVTIAVIQPVGLRSMEVGPPVVRLYGSSCNGANATVTGVVSGMPSGSIATVTASTGETQPTDTSGNFSICIRANASTTTQTLTAQVGAVSCGGYSGSTGQFNVVSGGTYTEPITVTAEGTCPTPPPTPTPTPVTCTNQEATVTGVVSGLPVGQTATITASTGETAGTDLVGNYTICVKANGSTNSQTLTAQVGSPTCGGNYGSVGPFAVTGGGTNTEPIALAAESACPTPSVNPAPGVTCTSPTVPDTDFIQVTVTYPSPIFVPFIGAFFQSQPGIRTITTTVTDAIEPCSLTLGS
jgi:Flp pilus assembly protein TadG